MRVIPRAAFVERPWRNGGGMSWMAIEEADLAMGLAAITEAGPFSDWSGWDRTLTVVEGEGLVLGGVPLQAGEPHAFDGGAPIAATPTRGPVLVWNVLTRRPLRHAVRAAPGDARGDYALALGTLDLHVLAGGHFAGDGLEVRLGVLRRGEPVVNGRAEDAPGHGGFWLTFSRLCATLRRIEARLR